MYIHNYILNLVVFVDEAKAMLDEDEEQFEKENIFREVDFNFLPSFQDFEKKFIFLCLQIFLTVPVLFRMPR